MGAFQALWQACVGAPILTFADCTGDFLLGADASGEGLGVVLSWRWADGQYHPVACGSWVLMAHEGNYHSARLEFLVLGWAIAEHFGEYLLCQPFLVRADSDPLTYIMAAPSLDAAGHQWVGALVGFNFQLECWGPGWCSSGAAELLLTSVPRLCSLSWMGWPWVQLRGQRAITSQWLKVTIMWRGVHVAIGWVQVKMHVTNWAAAQREGPVLGAMLD